MLISIPTDKPLSDQDRAILTALLNYQGGSPETPAVAESSEPEEPTEAPEEKPVKKVKKAEPEPAKKPEPEPADKDDESETAADEDEAAGDEPTLDDAVALATKLMSGGKAADVKAALGTVGAKRVSELKGSKIAAFIEALGA